VMDRARVPAPGLVAYACVWVSPVHGDVVPGDRGDRAVDHGGKARRVGMERCRGGGDRDAGVTVRLGRRRRAVHDHDDGKRGEHRDSCEHGSKVAGEDRETSRALVFALVVLTGARERDPQQAHSEGYAPAADGCVGKREAGGAWGGRLSRDRARWGGRLLLEVAVDVGRAVVEAGRLLGCGRRRRARRRSVRSARSL
jgi:hypothetical protein